MPINQFVGARLREFRKKSGKSQIEIAEYLSLSQSAYAKLETGETAINTERIYKLCQLLDKPFKSFFPPLKSTSVGNKLEAISKQVDKGVAENQKYVRHLEEKITFLRNILNEKMKK